MSREMRCIHKIKHMGVREKDEKEGAKDEEEKEGAKERAVKVASERPSWKECGHEGEEREQVMLSRVRRYPQTRLLATLCQLPTRPRPRPSLKKGRTNLAHHLTPSQTGAC